MNPDPQVPPISPSIVRITTGGIQNLAALIPLLTTRLCEKHVTIALQKGLLYAAAAPMTIFGSLGIAQAGFIALCGSIDYPFFHGPALLRNAGFHPTGVGELLLHVKEDKHHLYNAEDKLRTILNKKKVWGVTVNLRSKDFWVWNFKLAAFTFAFCCFGMTPYIFLIFRYLSHMPFQETWIFPILRICGSGLVVVNIQILFQLRLLEETYCRLRFIAADNYLKRKGKSIPSNWDPNERSRKVFADLEETELQDNKANTNPLMLDSDDKYKILNGVHKLRSFKFCPLDDEVRQPHPTQPVPTPSLHTLHSQRHQPRSDTMAMDTVEQGSSLGPHTPDPGTPTLRVETTSSTMSSKASTKMERVVIWLTRQITTVLLWGTRLVLFFGVICTIVGYIGCFTVVQANQDGSVWKGSLVWLVCEVVLSFTRTMIWAANPTWDDAKFPIVLEKVLPKDTKGCKSTPEGSSSYGVGWALDSPTADDMHALIIGIDSYNSAAFGDLERAKSDAISFEKYLEGNLLVPRSQIRTLYDSEATRSKIEEELKSLRHRGSVTADAPIVIYFAGHSFVSELDECAYLVPHLPSGDKSLERHPEDYCLAYSVIVDLLRHVADEKTDNIVVILDSCHAGLMGVGDLDSGPGSPRTSNLSHHPSIRRPPAVEGGDVDGLPVSADSISRIPQTLGEDLLSTTLTGQPYTPMRAAEELDATDSQLTRLGPQVVGHRRSLQNITQATTEILIGHSSHLLLAGAAATQQAHEDPEKGGQFTQALLEVLKEAEQKGELQRMTYRTLVEAIRGRFQKRSVGVVGPEPKERMLSEFQTALCTTIYQNRHLFDGLFKRKVDNRSAKPVMRVLYSD